MARIVTRNGPPCDAPPRGPSAEQGIPKMLGSQPDDGPRVRVAHRGFASDQTAPRTGAAVDVSRGETGEVEPEIRSGELVA